MIFKNSSTPEIDYTLEDVIGEVLKFIEIEPDQHYRLIVGTDSLYRSRGTVFATVIVCHRVGKAARFWYTKRKEDFVMNLYVRIMKEAEDSIQIMKEIYDSEIIFHIKEEDMEIHIDAGENGDSIRVMKDCMGYVRGSGYNCQSKPDSIIATHCADRITK